MTNRTKKLEIREALAALKEPGERLLVFSLTGCAPCEVVKHGIAKLEDQDRLGEFEAIECLIDRHDKKGLGQAFLAGIKTFPTVRIVSEGKLFGSYNTVPEDWTGDQIAHFLEGKLQDARNG